PSTTTQEPDSWHADDKVDTGLRLLGDVLLRDQRASFGYSHHTELHFTAVYGRIRPIYPERETPRPTCRGNCAGIYRRRTLVTTQPTSRRVGCGRDRAPIRNDGRNRVCIRHSTCTIR